MPLYPTLEDLKVDEIATAQAAHMQPHYPPQQQQYQHPTPYTPPGYPHSHSTPPPPPAYGGTMAPSYHSNPSSPPLSMSLYPSLTSYMGLNLATVRGGNSDVARPDLMVVAPVSQVNAIGIKRAEIQPGLRKVVVCKDARGKIGLNVRDISKGVFVACVHANTPAAMAGLRFGDQILEVNGQAMAGYTSDKATNVLKSCKGDKIEMVVRDRPFERAVTLNKDSNGYVGFCFSSSGKITSIVKDSSAARNGLLIEHHLVEVDGKNVVGMTEKEIARVIEASPRSVTVTIMPSMLFEHMVKCVGQSVLRKHMDRSLPDV